MRYKVAWLFMWVTLAFWTGCAGENQNYKINQEQTPMFREPPSGGPASSNSATASPAPGSEAKSPAEAAPAKSMTTATGKMAMAEPAGKSVTGLKRDNWKPIVVEPDDGRVAHHPHYIGVDWANDTWGHCWSRGGNRPSPLLMSNDIAKEAQMATARAGAPFDKRDMANLVKGPVKTSIDIVTLPYWLIARPPCKTVYSPDP